MKKLMLKRQNSMNNKGFSLVELIIVIAIMAVLIAVLAPQFIKYVEQSRQSSDINTLDEIFKTTQVLCVDDATSQILDNGDSMILTADSDGDITVTFSDGCALTIAHFNEFLGNGWEAITLKSKNAQSAVFTINFTGTDGAVTASWASTPTTIIKGTT